MVVKKRCKAEYYAFNCPKPILKKDRLYAVVYNAFRDEYNVHTAFGVIAFPTDAKEPSDDFFHKYFYTITEERQNKIYNIFDE
jgi:hypoxanthine phosphoribosyltransferase